MNIINLLPSEVLEVVFRHLPLAIDQQNLCLVCKKWRDIIQQMRRIPSLLTYKQCVYLRLPAAGSFNEVLGNKGFAVIFTCTQDILLCGMAIFLPHGTQNDQNYDKVNIKVTLGNYAVPQIGAQGPEMACVSHEVSHAEVKAWTGPLGCSKNLSNQWRTSLHCLPGTWL